MSDEIVHAMLSICIILFFVTAAAVVIVVVLLLLLLLLLLLFFPVGSDVITIDAVVVVVFCL